MAEWLAMGGYAWFVWPCYAASVIGIGGLAWWFVRDAKRVKERLAEAEKAAG